MTNPEYLIAIREADNKWHKRNEIVFDNLTGEDWYGYRRTKALEIIAESLVGIDDKLNSLIIDGKVINVGTHEV